MKSRNKAGTAWLALATVLFVTAGASPSWGVAQNTLGEGKCQSAIAKSVVKHTAVVAKAMASCQNAVLAGAPGPCPDADAQTAIDKSAAKVAKYIIKPCQSTCDGPTALPCIGDSLCPPNGDVLEKCTAGGQNVFDLRDMGFPGPYCESVIDKAMANPEDFEACAIGLSEIVAGELLDNIFGDLVTLPGSEAAQKCLERIAKAAPKAVTKMASAVAKCRNTQLTASSPTILPDSCPTTDLKVAGKISKLRAKVLKTIEKSCPEPSVAELDLCGAGVGGIADVAAAQACIGQMLDEASYSIDDANTRPFAPISIINAAYPATAAAVCGDDLINQIPNQFLPIGEECDGTDLGDCDACLPPGDIFECSCAETRRTRAFADGFAADLDNGWSGASHNAKVTDGAGFVAEITPGSCDCTEFTGATCTGTTSDSVCDLSATLNPRCSHRLFDNTTCDSVGNTNGANTNQDCQTCDEFAGNAGDFCTGTARYCVGGGSDGLRCNQPGDCPFGSCDGIGRCLTGPFAGDGCKGPQNCGVCTAGNIGAPCSLAVHCGGGGVCQPNTCSTDECLGGANHGLACGTNGDCGGSECVDKTSDCESQCYPVDDDEAPPTGPCWRQTDCAEGERCRGVCDKSNFCLIMRNGAPLPLSAEGTSVCIDSQFFSNMTGTRDIVTGEHAINYELRSVTVLADTLNTSPCPVCGGWCAVAGQDFDRGRCSGSCSGPELECRFGPNIGDTCLTNADCDDDLCAPLACRFDDDCPGGGTCSGTGSPECGGGACRLDLACNLGPNIDQPCRIEASTAFGTTSVDCPPQVNSLNISGSGLAISWTPLTSGIVTHESPAACDAAGYQNYDCNCLSSPVNRPGADNTRNQPNRCQPACNAGANFGDRCSGFTVCVGGTEAGVACDEDSDCSGVGATCTGNPGVCGIGNAGECSISHCVLGTNPGAVCFSNAQCQGGGTCPAEPCTVGGAPCLDGVCDPDACTTNADCEMGVTCDDACPGGLCTPLCVERGHCVGGTKDGLQCALDVDCLGGGVCDSTQPRDDDEGACAQGTFNHCDGPGWEFVSCSEPQLGTQTGCGAGGDGILGNSDDSIGAGFCVADISNCYINDGLAEGGSTLNGKGDPTNAYSVATYCIPPSTSPTVNPTAGIPGPGRIRQPSLVVPNFTSLP